MNVSPIIECTRTSIGEINAEDRVFSARIIVERVAEKLHVPEEQILSPVFYYLKNLISLNILERLDDTQPLCDDSVLWISAKNVKLFVPST